MANYNAYFMLSVLCLLVAINHCNEEKQHSWSFLSDSQSYLKINGTTNIGNILKFRFKSYDYHARLVRAQLGQHWLSLSLDAGFLAVSLDRRRLVVPRLNNAKVNDMEWHAVKLIVDQQGGLTFWIDRLVFYLPLPQARRKPKKPILWDNVWFGTSGRNDQVNNIQNSFVGCLHLLKPRPEAKDGQISNMVDKSQSVADGCLDACVIQTCANGGRCINRVNHAICDCMGTGYDGPTCEQESPVIFMDGASFIAFDTAENPDTDKQEFAAMRFKTNKPSGLLLKTSFAEDHILILLKMGKICASLDFGEGTVTFESNKIVNDGEWHFLKLQRHVRLVSLFVDGAMVGGSTLTSNAPQLRMEGGEELVYFGGTKKGDGGTPGIGDSANFTGCIQQLRFGHVDLVHSILYLNDWRLTFYGDKSKTCENNSR